jgi:dUTP pyrophosphatase
MKIKIKKLKEDAKLPTYGHPGDAGMDVYSIEEVIFLPGEQKRVHTGVAFEIPDGYVGLMWDKSGISFNQGLKVMGGVIDSGFRGEFVGSMINLSSVEQKIEKGQKFTQMLIQPVALGEIVEVDTLSDTPRGVGREGSTGKI